MDGFEISVLEAVNNKGDSRLNSYLHKIQQNDLNKVLAKLEYLGFIDITVKTCSDEPDYIDATLTQLGMDYLK